MYKGEETMTGYTYIDCKTCHRTTRINISQLRGPPANKREGLEPILCEICSKKEKKK